MKYCVLNKNYIGIVANEAMYKSLIQTDLNSEHYAFHNVIESSTFMANINSNVLNDKRTKILNKFAKKNTIAYMTYSYVERIGGYAFAFFIRENGKYRFETYTVALTSHIMFAFQEAYTRVFKDNNLGANVYILTNQTTLINYMNKNLTNVDPLKEYKSSDTNAFVKLCREHPLVLTYIPNTNYADIRLLAILAKKNELTIKLKSSNTPEGNQSMKKINDVLALYTKIPVLLNYQPASLVNTYKEFCFKLTKPLEVDKTEFIINTTKLDKLMSVSKEYISNKSQEDKEQPEVEEEVLTDEMVEELEEIEEIVENGEESKAELVADEDSVDEEDDESIKTIFTSFKKMLNS